VSLLCVLVVGRRQSPSEPLRTLHTVKPVEPAVRHEAGKIPLQKDAVVKPQNRSAAQQSKPGVYVVHTNSPRDAANTGCSSTDGFIVVSCLVLLGM